jgi:hypothetical protein
MQNIREWLDREQEIKLEIEMARERSRPAKHDRRFFNGKMKVLNRKERRQLAGKIIDWRKTKKEFKLCKN